MTVSASKHVSAVALIHPAFIEVSDSEKLVSPLCLIDSKDEDKATMDKLIEEIKKKPFGEKVFRHRYDTMFHGFCAGRANYGNEDNAKYAKEVTLLL
jgi:dienelactone hydrolase